MRGIVKLLRKLTRAGVGREQAWAHIARFNFEFGDYSEDLERVAGGRLLNKLKDIANRNR